MKQAILQSWGGQPPQAASRGEGKHKPLSACPPTIAGYMTTPVVRQTGGSNGKRRFLVPEVQHAGTKLR
jgi:hypothetical protein